MLTIKETIIVEGKFDKERVKQVCSAPVICTEGFRIFKSKEMLKTIRSLAETTGIIVLPTVTERDLKSGIILKPASGAEET